MSGHQSLVVAVCVAAGLTAACSNDLPIEPPESIPKVQALCTDLSSQLPETVAGELVRETKPEDESTAAWGSPAIVLRCGVSRPTRATPGAQLQRVDGVDWFGEEIPEGQIFTSWGRRANVEVTIPDDYPALDALVALAPAVKGSVPPA